MQTLILRTNAPEQSDKWISASTVGSVGSTFGSKRLRSAMANHMNRHFSPRDPLDAENLTVSCGTTATVEMLAFALADEGEGVLLDRPVYSSHENDLRLRTGYTLISL
jgi:1-aminocyclopropane-1-carboxylate synthase